MARPGFGLVQVLVVKVSIGVNFTIGSAGAADPLPRVAVLPLLAAAPADPRSWSATISDDMRRSVTLVGNPANAQQLLVHPMGRLTVGERVVPLDFAIDRFGNDAPADGAKFAIGSVQLNGQTLTQATDIADTTDDFARRPFVHLSDAAKLADASFEPFHNGKQIGPTTVAAPSPQAQLTEAFTLYYVDDLDLASVRITPNQYVRPLDLTLALLGQSANANVPVRHKGDAKYVVPGAASPIGIAAAQYVVVDVASLAANGTVSPAADGVTQAQAKANLQATSRREPGGVRGNSPAVVALYEAAA